MCLVDLSVPSLHVKSHSTYAAAELYTVVRMYVKNQNVYGGPKLTLLDFSSWLSTFFFRHRFTAQHFHNGELHVHVHGRISTLYWTTLICKCAEQVSRPLDEDA